MVNFKYLHVHWWRTTEEIKTKCGQQKAIIYTNLQSAERTPNISGVQAKALGSKSLSTEHAYIKMLQITQWKKSLSLHYFTAQNVYFHFIHVFVCICMHIYTHIKCTLNIFNMHIQIHFVTRRYHCHTNVLFYVSVCKHSCAHTGVGRCVFGWT